MSRRWLALFALTAAALLQVGGIHWRGTDLVCDSSCCAQDVASAGGPAQSTTVLSYTVPTSGLYIASISASATTLDTVTITVSYTDAVNNTAQTVTPISAVALGTNGVTSSSWLCRASAAAPIVVRITISTQTTTKASAVVIPVG